MKVRSSLWYRWSLIMPLVMILVLGLVVPVQAASFGDGPVIGPDEVIDDDVFLDGDAVRMEGTVNGNLMATGNTVTISGTVNGDVFAFGNLIVIAESGEINGNLFVGGQNITIDGKVSGSIAGGSSTMVLGENASAGLNLYYGGYALTSEAGSEINRGMYAGAYQAVLDGDVARNLNIAAAAVELNGAVGGDVVLDVEASDAEGFPSYWSPPGAPAAITPGLRISENAEIGGSLTYTSPKEQADAIQTRPEGGIVFQTPVPADVDGTEVDVDSDRMRRATVVTPFLRWMFKFMQRLVTLLLLAGLALWLLPKLLKNVADKAAEKPLPSAGYGFLALLVGYAGSFVAGIVILGVGILFAVITLGALSRVVFGIGFSSLALVFAVFLLLVNYGSKLVLAYLVGTRLLGQVASNAKNQHVWGTLLGVLLYVLMRSIPFLGWLVGLVATVFGLGAMWLLYQDWRNARKPAVETEVVEALPEA
ncbi:MAG: polymer-forming cytoskeletal protein [Anaerolineaceae bacterium]|nr:polymer-forming cytoskeletal protein [Anaerolineaceae bacterium]